MADAASPAARPILARAPARRPLSAPSPPTLASVPERLHAHGKAGLSPPAPRPRVLEPTFPPALQAGAVLTCVSLSTAPGSPFCS